MVGARQIGLTADLQGLPHTNISRIYRELSEKKKIQLLAASCVKIPCWCQRIDGFELIGREQ